MQELGPFCQSCSMPLRRPEDFGTGCEGYRVNDYCRYCYEQGKFTRPDASLAEMIDSGVRIMAMQGIMSESSARAQLTEVIPRLKRWRHAEPARVEGRGFTGGDEIC